MTIEMRALHLPFSMFLLGEKVQNQVTLKYSGTVFNFS